MGENPSVKIADRWCLVEDRTRVVLESDATARWLYWIPGDVVGREEAVRLGAVKSADEVPVRRKPGRPPGSKSRVPEENK